MTKSKIYIVERTDACGRIITGYRQEIESTCAGNAVDLWIEFYSAEMEQDLWTCDVQQAAD